METEIIISLIGNIATVAIAIVSVINLVYTRRKRDGKEDK
jgi:uncharacterized membrane protein